jgi:hypothetical protein
VTHVMSVLRHSRHLLRSKSPSVATPFASFFELPRLELQPISDHVLNSEQRHALEDFFGGVALAALLHLPQLSAALRQARSRYATATTRLIASNAPNWASLLRRAAKS